jgi:hypothetical protein
VSTTGTDADGVHAPAATDHAPAATSPLLERKLPPIAELAVVSVVMMMAGGIFMASHLPTPPPLAVPVALVAGGGFLTLVAVVLLARIRPFAWRTFFLVLRWALIAYFVIGGLLAFVFVHNHVTGSTLAVLVATLVVFAVDVPTVLAFTVARFQDPAG